MRWWFNGVRWWFGSVKWWCGGVRWWFGGVRWWFSSVRWWFGGVRWWFGGVMETSCHLDGTLFPFDSQTCSIVVESWAYSEAFVDLRNASNYVKLDGFNDDGKPASMFQIIFKTTV